MKGREIIKIKESVGLELAPSNKRVNSLVVKAIDHLGEGAKFMCGQLTTHISVEGGIGKHLMQWLSHLSHICCFKLGCLLEALLLKYAQKTERGILKRRRT